MDAEEQKLNQFEETAYQRYEESAKGVRVSGLDPDFIFILVFIAIPFDLVLGGLAIFDFFTAGISWIIGLVISIIPLIIIGLWDYWRSSTLDKAHSDAKGKLDKTIEEIQNYRESLRAKKQALEFKKGLKLTKSKTKFPKQQLTKKATRETGKRSATKQTAKIATRKMARKAVLKRGFIAIAGTSIPLFIGMIPWYTLWVLATTKNK